MKRRHSKVSAPAAPPTDAKTELSLRRQAIDGNDGAAAHDSGRDKAAPVEDASGPPMLPAAPEVLNGSVAESERPSTAVHEYHVHTRISLPVRFMRLEPPTVASCVLAA